MSNLTLLLSFYYLTSFTSLDLQNNVKYSSNNKHPCLILNFKGYASNNSLWKIKFATGSLYQSKRVLVYFYFTRVFI